MFIERRARIEGLAGQVLGERLAGDPVIREAVDRRLVVVIQGTERIGVSSLARSTRAASRTASASPGPPGHVPPGPRPRATRIRRCGVVVALGRNERPFAAGRGRRGEKPMLIEDIGDSEAQRGISAERGAGSLRHNLPFRRPHESRATADLYAAWPGGETAGNACLGDDCRQIICELRCARLER
ncbi:MAG: hypothetical protein WKF73_16825 [Nocardioidaceae bacterium]